MTCATTQKLGYSLIEVLTVLAITGILFALATPAWQQHVLRSQRADAATTLLRINTRQAQFLLLNNRYATAEQLTLPAPDGLGIAQSAQQHYDVSLEAHASGYLASARARADRRQFRDTTCRIFNIDALGQRSSQDMAGNDTTNLCWP